tara:strand:+ start:50 stop:193 length:144 start_codon:yes stop_codon:yes gene_type:complete
MAQVPNKILILANTHEGPKYLGLERIRRSDFINGSAIKVLGGLRPEI